MLERIPNFVKAAMPAANPLPLDIYSRRYMAAPNGRKPKPGDKLRRRTEAGTLAMQNPGGLVSETFRDKARERNIERLKAKGFHHGV